MKKHLPILLVVVTCLFLTVPVYAQTHDASKSTQSHQDNSQNIASEIDDAEAVKKANKIKAKEEKRLKKARVEASKQAKRAAEMEKQAEQAKRKAEKAKQKADNEKKKAEKARLKAEKQQRKAEQAASKIKTD